MSPLPAVLIVDLLDETLEPVGQFALAFEHGVVEGTETVLLGYALRGDLMRAAFADFRGDKVLIGRSPLGQSVERARWDSAGRGPTVSFSRSCWA